MDDKTKNLINELASLTNVAGAIYVDNSYPTTKINDVSPAISGILEGRGNVLSTETKVDWTYGKVVTNIYRYRLGRSYRYCTTDEMMYACQMLDRILMNRSIGSISCLFNKIYFRIDAAENSNSDNRGLYDGSVQIWDVLKDGVPTDRQLYNTLRCDCSGSSTCYESLDSVNINALFELFQTCYRLMNTVYISTNGNEIDGFRIITTYELPHLPKDIIERRSKEFIEDFIKKYPGTQENIRYASWCLSVINLSSVSINDVEVLLRSNPEYIQRIHRMVEFDKQANASDSKTDEQ